MKKNKTNAKLQNIFLQYGKTVHDLVASYPDSANSMASIGKKAHVSRESIRLWIKEIFGTTQKTKPRPKTEYKPNIIKQYVPELLSYSFEAKKSKLYKIVEPGKLVLVRKGSWKTISKASEKKFFVLLWPTGPKPDLVVIVINKNERYVIPPIPGIRKLACLSKKTLMPYLNRFDYITSDREEAPIIEVGSGKSVYRGVLKHPYSFSVSASISGEKIYLGSYKTEEVAALVYDKAVLYFCPKRALTNGLSAEPFEEEELARLIRSFSENRMNRYRGVDKRGEKFRATIGYHKERLYLGVFDSEIEAAEAYNKKALELFGEKAKLNIF